MGSIDIVPAASDDAFLSKFKACLCATANVARHGADAAFRSDGCRVARHVGERGMEVTFGDGETVLMSGFDWILGESTRNIYMSGEAPDGTRFVCTR